MKIRGKIIVVIVKNLYFSSERGDFKILHNDLARGATRNIWRSTGRLPFFLKKKHVSIYPNKYELFLRFKKKKATVGAS